MTSILENDLVFKYFGCEDNRAMAERVLHAMQEPIRKGDKMITLLLAGSNGNWQEHTHGSDKFSWGDFHPFCLRLPSRFQPSSDKKECAMETKCEDCNEILVHQPPPNKFDEAVKRSFEEDRIIEPGKVFEKPEKCRYNHGTGSVCDCAPDPAIEAKIEEILGWFMNDLGQRNPNGVNWSYGKFKEKLHELARRSDR